MRRHMAVLILALSGAFAVIGWSSVKDSARYTFTAESTLQVNGTSTIHAWKATATSLAGGMEVTGGSDLLHGGTLTRGTLTIPVAALDCDNPTMNKKMREALKADAHKTITFELTGAEMVGTPGGATFQLLAKGKLTLAGVQKPIEVTLNGEDLGSGKFRLKGSYSLLMTSHGMKPPTAMMGTLKTGDKVTIEFNLVATEVAAV